MYEQFAKFYDELGWGDFAANVWHQLNKYFKDINFAPKSMLDLACGTGILTIKAAQAAMEVQGLDISETMLSKARINAEQSGVDVSYILADMRHFHMNRCYDLITCTFDAINHILDYAEWIDVFKCAFIHLNSGGKFIFDMNTVKDLNENWDNIHVRKDGNNNYVLSKSISFKDKGKAMACITFTAFIKRHDGLYEGYEETVTEASFPVSQVISSLYDIGFAKVETKDAQFEDVVDGDNLNRVFILCSK